jgi:16S rRNA (cytosine1402-N4)-methyltransferase
MGGHAERLLDATPRARLLGIDGDPEALRRAGQRLARFGDRVTLRHGSFRDVSALAHEAGFGEVDAVLLDLGLSSYQLEESRRGFSFQADEPLDMRFDPSAGPTAAELLSSMSAEEIARILREYGEERHARRIARRIAERRIRTTTDLAAAVKDAVPRAAWPRRIHVATRTFQAVRMAVNHEPEALAQALPQAVELLGRDGRLGVISFHSGEDRIVKRAFRSFEKSGAFAALRPAPIQPGEDEVAQNPRARSAKLRVLERVEAA